MNNKEFIGTLSKNAKMSVEKTTKQVAQLIGTMLDTLQQNNVISINGFGTLEVKQKAERISVNPTTGERSLVPPKLSLTYKPSDILKDKLNKK